MAERDNESQDVGQSSGGESTGHASGRRIVDLLRTRKADLTLARDRVEYLTCLAAANEVHRAPLPRLGITPTSQRSAASLE